MALTFLDSLQVLRDVSVDAAGALVIMARNAAPNGAITCTPNQLLQDFNQTFSKRVQIRTFRNYQKELIDARLVPSGEAVYPMAAPDGTDMNAERRTQMETAIDLLQRDLTAVRPHPDRQHDHGRVFAALTAADALEVAALAKRTVLADDHGDPALVDGRRVQVERTQWNYALVQKWISDHTCDKVVKTVMELHLADAFKAVLAEKKTADSKKTQAALLAIMQAGLNRTAAPRGRRRFDTPGGGAPQQHRIEI